jgi:hypothetical protein
VFAANLVFDGIVDDLVVSEVDRERLGVDRLVDEHLPARHRYDAAFLRKLLATAAKVAQDLAGEEFTYPACTGEELVLCAILREWQVLLDLTDLGPACKAPSEYLFEDLDFEYLFDAQMDGVEDDPLAHKTSNIDVRPPAHWFAPFHAGSRVHPYALERHEPDLPDLFDLTQSADHGHHLTHPVALTEMPEAVDGRDPVSELVAAARRDARTHRAQGAWVPDENDPVRSFAEIAAGPTTSGILIHQTGPDGEIAQVLVLSFIA